MKEQPEQTGRTIRLPAFRAGLGRIGVLGLVLAPVAILVYLIVLPLFGLFWLIEWLLPLHAPEHRAAEESFRVMEIASPPKHD
jgi:hypothetical protein